MMGEQQVLCGVMRTLAVMEGRCVTGETSGAGMTNALADKDARCVIRGAAGDGLWVVG